MKTFIEKTGGNGLSDLHFISFLLVLRQGSPLCDWRAGKIGFGAEDKMIFEAEKKRRKRAGEMGSSYVLSYVLKSAVELELFSNLWYFKNYFFQLLYIYQESLDGLA